MGMASEVTRDDLTALAVLLADVREDITEVAGALQQLKTAPTPRPLVAPTPVAHPRRWRWGVVLAGVLGCGVLLGWGIWGQGAHQLTAQARLMGQLDTVLRDHEASLPRPVRDVVKALYTQAGFQPPGQR